MQFLKSHVSCSLWLLLGGFKQTSYHLEDWQLGKGHKFLDFFKGKVSYSLSSAALFCFPSSQLKVVLPIVVIEGVGQGYNLEWHNERVEPLRTSEGDTVLLLVKQFIFFYMFGENLFETSKVHKLSGSRVFYILKLFSKLLLFCKCNGAMSLNAEVFGCFFCFFVLEVRCLATRSSIFVKTDLGCR